MSEPKKRNEAYYEAIFQDAMALLIKKHTFFGHILAHMVRISSKDIMTMGVTVNEKGQILLFYNTDMIRREIEENHATLKNITALIQHEVYHVINEHFLRQVKGKYHAWVVTTIGPMLLFNVAGDLSINQFIDELPDWVLKLDSFKGIKLPKEDTAETYYKLLYQESQKQAKQNKGKLNGLGKAVGILLPSPESKAKKDNATGIDPNAGKSEEDQKQMPCPYCDGTGQKQEQIPGEDGQQGQGQQTQGQSKPGEGTQGQDGDEQGDGDEEQDGDKQGDGDKEQDGEEDESSQKQKKCPHCKGSGNAKTWNQMTDMEKINMWLPYDPEFFQKLMDELRKMGQSPTSKQTGLPGDHSRWNDVSKIPAEMIDETIKQMVKEVYNKVKFGGRGIGNLPAGIERMCKETIKPAYNFEPYLRRFVDGELFGRYVQTRKRPNRRYRWEYPGSKTETLGKIGVLADSSGSIYDEDIALFAKNLENMSQYVQIVLFDVDAGIQNLREYSKRNFDKVIKGGGGTDFSDVFAILKNYDANRNLLKHLPREQLVRSKFLLQGIQALIIMTDGMASGVPDKEPKHLSVMWAITAKCHQPPVRWGDKIYLDNSPEKHKKSKY
jgi:predicted metal-dependent peptidase